MKTGIDNASAVIHDPSRNALIYLTPNQSAKRDFIVATFDLDNNLYGENVHRAISIHDRKNISTLLTELGKNATIFVKNENELNNMLPGNQIWFLVSDQSRNCTGAELTVEGSNMIQLYPGWSE